MNDILCKKTKTITRLYKVKDKRLRWCTKGHVILCTPPPTCDTHFGKRRAEIGTVTIWEIFVRERGNWLVLLDASKCPNCFGHLKASV